MGDSMSAACWKEARYIRLQILFVHCISKGHFQKVLAFCYGVWLHLKRTLRFGVMMSVLMHENIKRTCLHRVLLNVVHFIVATVGCRCVPCI